MDHKDLCEHTKIRLIAAAVSHQQCTKTASNIIPLPGTDRVIAIGTPAEVRGLVDTAQVVDDIVAFGASLLGHASTTDGMDEEEARAWVRELWAAWSVQVTHSAAEAAPAPQQSELTDERIEAIWNSIDGKAVITGENQMNWNSALRRAFACAIEREVAKAAPAAPVQTAEPKRIPDMLTVETIQGAIAFGRMGINSPPSPDHWGNEFWQIGRQLAKLSETSAWDNVTPVDVAAPVQAEQAQAEPVPQSVLDTLWQRVTDAREAAYTFGDTCKEAVEIALDGVLDMLVQADLALPAQAEQAAAVRAAEWMPIATVPMDGTEVLLYLPAPYNRVVKARWFDVWENWIEGDFPDPQDEYCGIGSQLPTHWTHLPAAPSTATSNDTGALGDTGGTK